MTKGLRPQDWVGAQVLPPRTCVTLNILSQFSSVAQSCPTLWDTVDYSTPGFPILHYLPEFTQAHVHWVGGCHPSFSSSASPSPPTFNLSQHQGLIQWVGSFPVSWLFTSCGQSIRASAAASVLPMSIQDWFPLGWTDLISLQSRGLSRVFSNTTVQKH